MEPITRGATKVIKDRRITKHKAIVKCTNNKKRNNTVPFLSDELIFLILVRLSADFLFNTMRCVCKQWYNIIKDPLFIKEHVYVHSCYAGLAFHCRLERTVYFAHFGREKATLSMLTTLPSSDSQVFSICDGLILFRCNTRDKVYVANPLTKQLITLPPISRFASGVTYWLKRDDSLFEYKVVFTCFCQGRTCGVITLGKDVTWRLLYVPSYFQGCPSILYCWPLVVGKFIHWTSTSCPNMLTFDVESETFFIASVPKPHFVDTKCKVEFVARGGCVTFMIGLHGKTLWEVWSLSRGIDGECKKVCDIDFRPRKHLSRVITKLFREGEVLPVAWIDNNIVVFRDHSPPYSFISHNIKTGYTYQLTSCHNHIHSYGIYSPYASTLVSIR